MHRRLFFHYDFEQARIGMPRRLQELRNGNMVVRAAESEPAFISSSEQPHAFDAAATLGRMKRIEITGPGPLVCSEQDPGSFNVVSGLEEGQKGKIELVAAIVGW